MIEPARRSTDPLRISANYVRAVWAAVANKRDHCSDDSDLCAIANVLADRDALDIDIKIFLRFVAALDRLIGKHWPLDAVSAWRTPMHGLLNVAVQSAQTTDAALAILQQFGPVRAPFVHIKAGASPAGETLIFYFEDAVPNALRDTMSLIVALSALAMLEQIIGERRHDVVVCFQMARPQFAPQVEAALGAKVHYAARDNAITVPRALLSLSSPFADARVHATARSDLETAELHSATSDLFVATVRRLIAAPQNERPSEDHVARQLAISRSTLTRRLKANGTNFRTLCDAHRQERAAALQRQGLRREAIADALGYADPTSLSRAMRRWTQS